MKFLHLLLLIVGVEEAAAQKKLPSSISQHLYCLGCIATIKELETTLGRRHITAGNRDVKVMEALDNICQAQNFRAYEYSPPKTVKACELLLENHEEDIEKALSNSKKGESVEKLICYEISGACDGVDIKEKQKRSQLADIDLTGDGKTAKSFTVDPNNPERFIKTDEKKNEGKTLSKNKKGKKKAEKETKSNNENVKKGSFDQINVDINDPSSIDKVMKKIKDVTDQKKTEL